MQIDYQQLQHLAHTAIYSTDIKVKVQAEQQLQKVVFNLPVQHLPDILNGHSSTTALAIASSLAFNVTRINNVGSYLDNVNLTMRSWFSDTDGRFYRNQNQLYIHCSSTIFKFMGKAMKELFKVAVHDKQVLQWLMNKEQGDKYRLYLFLAFIEEVNTLDSQIGFIPYRIMLQSFQNMVVPEMFGALLPYFMNFSQNLEMSGLIIMQANLSLQKSQNDPSALHSHSFTPFSAIIFKLLEEIVSFKYNMNYKDYDDLEITKVSFPESIFTYILKTDFLSALFIAIHRLIELKNQNFFSKCLECLQKILTVKFSSVPQNYLYKFIAINLKGIVELLTCFMERQIGSRQNLQRVVGCSCLFQDIFSCCTIQDIGKLQNGAAEYLKHWVQLCYALPIKILSSSKQITSQNQLFINSVLMMKTMATDISNMRLMQETQIRQLTSRAYQQFMVTFFSTFLNSNNNILGNVEFSMETYKLQTKKFFGNIVKICSVYYQQFFKLIKEAILRATQKIQHNQHNLSNVLLTFAVMIDDQAFFEVNLFNEYLFQLGKNDGILIYPKAVQELGELFNVIFQFIEHYANNYNYGSFAINHSLLVFYQAVLSRFTENLQINSQQNEHDIKDRLFQLISLVTGVNYNQFLMKCLIGFSTLISYTEEQCIQFIFTGLHTFISTIKHKFPKEMFKYTSIYKQMLNLLRQLTQSDQISKGFMRWRILLFKTLSILFYDKQLDDYRGNIRESVAMVSPKDGDDIQRVMYDLIGICEGMQSTESFEYFLSKALHNLPNFPQIINALFLKYYNNMPHLKDFLHLTYLLIKQRPGAYIRLSQLYNMIKMLLPLWNRILHSYCMSTQKSQLFQEIYLITRCLIKEGHINLALIEDSMSQEQKPQLKTFIIYSLSHLKAILDEIQQLPELLQTYFATIESYILRLAKYLFSIHDPEAAQCFTSLIYGLMNKLILIFPKVLKEEYTNKQLFQHIKICKLFFQFIIQSQVYRHQHKLFQHIGEIQQLTHQKGQFLVTVFMIGLHVGNRKELEILNCTTRLILYLCQLYPFNTQDIASRVGISNHQDFIEFDRIIKNIKEKKQTSSIFYQLQDWFKMQVRFMENEAANIEIEGY